ncbi:MAG: hypothetical protein KatS3mg004_1047 [Bryobacteraceae bacterium]|nr:MAG: hypothetical protein KatS3mg004_1047 [Bryobacteraceae bacterium]
METVERGSGMNRRVWLATVAAAAGGACSRPREAGWSRREPVFVIRARDYGGELAGEIRRALAECGIGVRGRRVLVKPNLVEFSRATAINTHPLLVAAVVEALERLGAAEVRIGEGPGHRRDTWTLAEEAGYFDAIPDFERRFVDLNRDDVAQADELEGHGTLWLPQTALGADLIVSMPKLKTHHWAGVTLSMKNLFGVVPGALYGWPKNVLHHYGIDRSIVKLAGLLSPRAIAIVDGIVGMEGNGPIQGRPRRAGVIVAGANLVAVDATCCRLMGIDPARVRSLAEARRLGPVEERWIEQRGEPVEPLRQDFELLPMWRGLRA